jgi:signal transduction histidine kinase
LSRSLLKPGSVLDIIWRRLETLKLRNKLALGYTVVFTLVFGAAFSFVYSISEKNRQEESYRRLRNRIYTTYNLMIQLKQIDNELLQIVDKNIVTTFRNQETMLFDSTGELIYNSLSNKQVDFAYPMISQLKKSPEEMRLSHNGYEILGVRFIKNNRYYYGVARAYDTFGKENVEALRYLLITIFFFVAIAVIILSFYLSNIITSPITRLTKSIDKLTPDKLSIRLAGSTSRDEVGFLSSKFNDLLEKVENAFKFQYHFINHLSHELKTPLAVMMTNAERALAEGNEKAYKASLEFQKDSLMELSHIINAMLDISKTEHRLLDVLSSQIRLDELLFECMDEINFLNPDAQFDFRMDHSIDNSDSLTVSGNSRMLKMAMMNLLKNATNYSKEDSPVIELFSLANTISIHVTNDGPTIPDTEQKNLFTHLFRGENSKHVKGFGLGLVLTHRIVSIHKGNIHYAVTPDDRNCFVLQLPLA